MPKKSNKRRADGRIAVQVYLGMVNGKRKCKTVYGKSQKEADDKAEAIKAKMRKGIQIDDSSFQKWRMLWLSTKINDVSHNHYGGLISLCNHLKDIDPLPLPEIKPYHIQNIINDLSITNPRTGKPTSKKTLTDVKSIVMQIFQLAIENRIIDYNPCSAVKIPKKAPKEKRRPLTEEERKWIIEMPHRAQLSAMIMLFAGLRRGEVIALTWDNINFADSTIFVSKSVEFIKGKPTVKETKTDAGLRTIHMPQILLDFLKNTEKNSAYVCPSLNGQMMTEGKWRRMWESYMCDLNLKYGNHTEERSKYHPKGNAFTIQAFTPHCLRHTYCTMLYEAGIDILTAQNQMGHADAKTTLTIYTHLDKIYKRHSMQNFDIYLTEKKLTIPNTEK